MIGLQGFFIFRGCSATILPATCKSVLQQHDTYHHQMRVILMQPTQGLIDNVNPLW